MAANTQDASPYPSQDWRNGFDILPASEPRIEDIIHKGPDDLALILDWDGVLAIKAHDGMNGTTWDILRRNMTADNQVRHAELYAQYHPYERTGSLTEEQAETWQRKAMQLLIGTSLDDIEADAREHVELRPGVVELFAIAAEIGVPTYVKSTGAAAIIRTVAEKYGIVPTHIFSNEFEVADGKIVDFVADSLTHSLNKHTRLHHLHPDAEDRVTTMLVGDNLHDVHMVLDREHQAGGRSLRVRLDGGRVNHTRLHGPGAWEGYVAESFRGGYDMVALEDNTFALNSMIRSIGQRAA